MTTSAPKASHPTTSMKQTWQDYNTCIKQMRAMTGSESMPGTLINLIICSGIYTNRLNEAPRGTYEFEKNKEEFGKFTTRLIEHHGNAQKISEKAEKVLKDLSLHAADRTMKNSDDTIMTKQIRRLESLSEQLEDRLIMFVDVIEKTLETESQASP